MMRYLLLVVVCCVSFVRFVCLSFVIRCLLCGVRCVLIVVCRLPFALCR